MDLISTYNSEVQETQSYRLKLSLNLVVNENWQKSWSFNSFHVRHFPESRKKSLRFYILKMEQPKGNTQNLILFFAEIVH